MTDKALAHAALIVIAFVGIVIALRTFASGNIRGILAVFAGIIILTSVAGWSG